MSPRPKAQDREPLTRESILGTAVEIVDREGLDALTMRRLAAEFDVEAMALYYHFPNKQAILDGVVDTIVGSSVDPAMLAGSMDWRDMMRSGILGVRQALLAHPNAVPLVTTRTAKSPGAAGWAEGPLQILHGAGLRGRSLATAYHMLVSYSLGWHLFAGDASTSIWHDGVGDVSENDVPALTATLAADLADWNDGFEEGLDIVLDGIGRMIDTRNGSEA
ncbi:MAG: TetR family transcriptional regulator [Actinobacteria bacterium]|nr:MAG: TetR family transcriptional regulator [Actinomycetota bacterium]